MLKVCVIIANYNHQKYLEESIRSIMAQTWHNLEIQVIDDGSNNQHTVRALVEKLQVEDDRIIYTELERNTGKWNALNKAIEQTDCQLVTTLDADDTCLPVRIERQVAAMTAIPNIAHVLTGFHHCWSDEDVTTLTAQDFGMRDLQIVGSQEVRQLVMTGKSSPGINHYFTGNVETAGASAMFTRDVWEMGIRFNPPGVGTRVLLSEDSDFNFRTTMLLNSTILLDEKLYCYRRNTSTNREEM